MTVLSDGVVSRRWRVLSDAFRTQLWPLPVSAVVLALTAGVVLPALDSHLDDGSSAAASGHLFSGGADAARSVLGTITGSLITVVALTFSVTVVTLQLASSQFSPRLLRTFMSDRIVRGTLALFLATFVYALTVLRTVRTDMPGQPGFVPELSLTVAYLLTVVSVLALVGFLSHLVRELRVETMLRNVHREASHTIEATFPERAPSDAAGPAPQAPADSAILLAGSSGFVTFIDEVALLDAAVDAGACIVIDRAPGSSLVAGTPVGRAWAAAPADPLSADRRARLQDATDKALQTDFERTAAQDIGFGLRQLTDVAVKALSPGINDPTTAVHALGHISALLCELAARDPGSVVRPDEHGAARLFLTFPDLAGLLDVAITQPRHYGATDPIVLARLFTLLRELAWSSQRPAHHQAIADQLGRLRGTVAEQRFDATERSDLAALASSVEDALNHNWRP
jgi:uncharacterized membrane protein